MKRAFQLQARPTWSENAAEFVASRHTQKDPRPIGGDLLALSIELQEADLGPGLGNECQNALVLVGAQIVHDNDISRPERGDQHSAHVGLEDPGAGRSLMVVQAMVPRRTSSWWCASGHAAAVSEPRSPSVSVHEGL